MEIKIKTGTAWGLLAALLLLTTQVEASTVSSVTNSTVDTGQIFSLDLLGTGFTGIVDGGGLNLSFNLFGFNSPLFSAKNSRMGRAKHKVQRENPSADYNLIPRPLAARLFIASVPGVNNM